MALKKKKEISSTEKLLDIIRKSKTPDELLKSIDSPPSGKSRKLTSLKIARKNKAISVGVDIGYNQLRLIKVTQLPNNKWKFLDYDTVPFRTDVPKGTPEFANFLKSELDKFCGSGSGFNLWANMSSARVEVTNIRIPKVPKKQIENAVYWTAKKNISFNEKETVFDFEIQGEIVESGVTKLAAMAYAAPKQEIEEMRDLFERIGYPLNGLTIAPFAIQNLFKTNWVPALEQTVATLYIGRDWSRIDIFSNGSLVLTRGIKAGINSMIQELMEGYNESVKSNILLEGSQVEETFESTGFTEDSLIKIEEARELVFGLSPDSPSSAEVRARFGLDENSISEMINPALERLVRQVERTLQHYTVTLGNEKISTIYTSATMNVYQPMIDYIGDELGVEKDVLDPLEPENSFVGEMTADISISERISFGPVLGVALADSSRTPNFLFTYREKEKESSISKVNSAIFSTLAIVVICCIGVLLWMGHVANQKKIVIAGLEQQLNQGIPVNEEIVSQLASGVKENQKCLKEYSERYQGMAVISELSTLTPSNIRLLHISADMGMASRGKSKKTAGDLTIEGFVSGDIKSLESSLAGYVFKLQSSPMFSQANINTSKIEPFGNTELLRFTLNVKFI